MKLSLSEKVEKFMAELAGMSDDEFFSDFSEVCGDGLSQFQIEHEVKVFFSWADVEYFHRELFVSSAEPTTFAANDEFYAEAA